MDRLIASNSVALSSAAQPAHSASTSAASAERPPSRSTPHLSSSDEQPGPDESGEEEPKKRCKHAQLVVSVEDVIIPKILQPIQTALAQEIDTFKAECEQWGPPKFGDDATENYKPPKFLLRNVYARWCSIRRQGCLSTLTSAQAGPAYAVIKGLLAVLHSDIEIHALLSPR